MPLMLVLDLDETLFQADLGQGPSSPISQSASKSLSESTTGRAINQPMLQDYKAKEIRAIARAEVKDLFNRIYEINKKAKENGKNPVIGVAIMTNGTYGEDRVRQLFDRYYGGDTDQRYSNNKFEMEYYNRTFYRANFDNGAPKIEKEIVMEAKFPMWEKNMPTLGKNNVYIIDNDYDNIQAAQKAGFKALHYATTPPDQVKSGKTYTTTKERTFQTLNLLLDKEEQKLNLEAHRRLPR